MPEKCENAKLTGHFFDLFLRKTRAESSRDCRNLVFFKTLRFQNVFRPT